MRGRDGRGGVCGSVAGGGGRRHGDGVDAVDGRGDVDGRVVLVFLGEGADEEREEREDDLAEGAHIDGCVGVGEGR